MLDLANGHLLRLIDDWDLRPGNNGRCDTLHLTVYQCID